MKKLLVLAAILFGLNTITNAQVGVTDDNNIKNFRFGLIGGTSFNWLNVNADETSKFENNGVGLGFNWGLQMEFKLNNNLSVVTGLSMNYDTYKLNFNSASSSDTIIYMLDEGKYKTFDAPYSTDSNIVTADMYHLKSRTYKANYVNIPINLKMKTNEIGYLTYYGQFGLNVGIKTGAKSKDERAEVAYSSVDSSRTFVYSTENSTSDKLNVASSVAPVRFGINIGGGAEYNLSGNTSVFFSLQYNHNFINVLNKSKNEDFLRKYNSSTDEFIQVSPRVIPGSVSLTVGILF